LAVGVWAVWKEFSLVVEEEGAGVKEEEEEEVAEGGMLRMARMRW